jgi:hypothetical protein
VINTLPQSINLVIVKTKISFLSKRSQDFCRLIISGVTANATFKSDSFWDFFTFACQCSHGTKWLVVYLQSRLACGALIPDVAKALFLDKIILEKKQISDFSLTSLLISSIGLPCFAEEKQHKQLSQNIRKEIG